ncbi:gas vesicle protein GvpP [Virgibacillus phasianinus]|uniref:Gas vesicle protein GvpP n=1 Tax=Virgibacillus phasianinus TaxID=2017483 RepID=A0A220U205_9BACI|nr:GvpT/GvpP family gas vesicle accessory protein [Virgibacillus phasianinus]ASK62107.1 gas vesicle protein GvpP [Virgibacillus phasianinus]
MVEESQANQNNDKQQSEDSNNSLNLALVGGVVGAGVGLLASPETGKKVCTRIGQSSVVKGAGREIRRTAQDIITEQMMNAFRQNASGYISKYAGGLLGKGKENEEEKAAEKGKSDFQEQYEELKEENNNLNENLQRIEEKLNALLEASSKK